MHPNRKLAFTKAEIEEANKEVKAQVARPAGAPRSGSQSTVLTTRDSTHSAAAATMPSL